MGDPPVPAEDPRPALSLRISIESELAWASKAMGALRGLLLEILGEEPGERFGLACSEAVNNAIIHAHGRNPDLVVEIELDVGRDRVEVRIADEGGDTFALESLAVGSASPYETAVGDLPESGLGLWLIRQGTDEVRYEKTERGGVLVLAINRPQSD